MRVEPDWQPYPGEWPPPWDKLDVGIRPVVQALVAGGYRTIASCEGHGEEWPWVQIGLDGSDPLAFAENLVSWLHGAGLWACYVHLIWELNKSYRGGRFVRVEWWSQQQVRDWPETEEAPGP